MKELIIKKLYGGEGGIRTPGTFYRTHAFQACTINHSDTSPKLAIFAKVYSRKLIKVKIGGKYWGGLLGLDS